MAKRPIEHELNFEQIEDLAVQIAALTEVSQIHYFGSRRWDAAVSFGLVEFILVTEEATDFTPEDADEILDKLSINVDAVLTFVEKEEDVMSRAILVWPLKS